MGHLVNADRRYRLLQQQLDRTTTGAPDSPALMKILRILFSEEDAELARKIPGNPTSLPRLSRKLGIPRDELEEKLDGMARRGVLIDLEHDGCRWFALAPVAKGFLEFTFMRVRHDLPVAELARLFDRYLEEDGSYARAAFAGQTHFSRTLVREEALPLGDHTEILDWERASEVVRSASAIGVSLCTCRHKATHLGKACDGPLRCCLSLNYAAESLLRNGFAEPLTVSQAMGVLEESKAAGLVQTADNVQRKAAYVCNCCGCCCELMQAMKKFNITNAIMTSSWVMEVERDECKGCGRCLETCPVGAIGIVTRAGGDKQRKLAECDQSVCLGCGVCYTACKAGAIAMKSRRQRAVVPENVFARTVITAIERGELAEMIFDQPPERLSHRALLGIVRIIEHSPVFKAAMAIRPLRSAFLNTLVAQGKKRMGPLSEEMT